MKEIIRAVYRLEDNSNLTFVSRWTGNDITDVFEIVKNYLNRENIPCDEIRVREGGDYLKAAGIKFFIVKIN